MRDQTIPFLTNGYDFGDRVWRRVPGVARSAPMRLLGGEALFVRGADGVRLFYDEGRISRKGAMPAFIREVLFGHGSVHGLDGADHRHRKATFVEVLYDDAQVARLMPYVEEEWRRELDDWIAGGRRSAYDAAVGAYGRAVMRWAGLPGTAGARTRWAAQLAQVVDGFGAPYSPAFIEALLNRVRSDRHARRLIQAVRAGRLEAREGTALAAWAWHRDREGELLSARLAGIELQNCMRPMIAVARFVAFAAKALHDRPDWRERIAAETAELGTLTGGPLATAFAQEVRRTAPFVPMLPGRAIRDLELDGRRLPKGRRVLLDILGTDLDAHEWADAASFDPQRFVGVSDYEALAAFVPQGGGAVPTGHRCPGEKLAIGGLASAVAALSDPRVDIADEGLDVNRRRFPTMPSSGGIVRPAGGCPFHAKA